MDFLFFILLGPTIADDQTSDLEEYQVMTEALGNGSFAVTSNPKLFKLSLWGAFFHEGTSTAWDLFRCCKTCESWNEVAQSTECDQAARSAIRTVVLGGLLAAGSANGVFRNKRELSSHHAHWTNSMVNGVKSGLYPSLDYHSHYTDSMEKLSYVILGTEKGEPIMNVTLSSESYGNGVVTAKAALTNSTLSKREANLFPLCYGQVSVDYCRNENYLLSTSSSGVYDAATVISNHAAPNGVNDSGYDDYLFDYYKTYVCDEANKNCDWYGSFRLWYADNTNIYEWSKCDNGL
ncbi:hypothetical protein TPHA_0B00100 [Tetrapisispora phaffii CBS 4417]|uniref:Uncharacterized protein n=1 Tax=Tetrapisispora phaffii (strain ATCC 24235 / CBS 4417 / NBRC 1672 / NRRL Y-8282 / UCD 70-5) TaxID=1071381 RepID=G8BQ86_TETPH|nr:hypothetical protein TPHA_0B00100 [Tetrapisispora phaffii CBS 4417]CCE61683.1 hypothetical protein TPHA_0B00100 [Tetrapisispora phaffii CBS 4417]